MSETPAEYNTISPMVARFMTEKELLETVRELAQTYGWLCYHTHNSKRSEAGFPDLVLCKPPRLLFLELKSEMGIISEAQAEWIYALKDARQEAYLCRPSDLPKIEGILGGVIVS